MQPFSIPVSGLKPGHNRFQWRVDGQFFNTFGDSGILAADIAVDIDVNYHGVTADVRGGIEGSVTVACDRCLEDLVIPVKTGFDDSLVPEGDELDFSQDVYDYVLTSLPLQRVHEEAGCNQETLKFLSK